MRSSQPSGAMQTETLELSPYNNDAIRNLLGEASQNIQQIKSAFDTQLNYRGNQFYLTGEAHQIAACKQVLTQLYQEAQSNSLTQEQIHLAIRSALSALQDQGQTHSNSQIKSNAAKNHKLTDGLIKTPRKLIKPRTENQKSYINNVLNHDFNFAIGPAGTGKTWLAMALAIDALERQLIDKIILVRPAVEAGEKLGFLPGDMEEKVNPYLRPLYDALHDMIGVDQFERYLEKGIIEIAPLAFMRGRTLNQAFIILDESQNTTAEQMKMFLTRIGFGSKVIITGDPSQVDLPRGITSGLSNAMHILESIPAISFSYFKSHDVVRHPTVQQIIDAYDNHS